jgi:hypothetical protein
MAFTFAFPKTSKRLKMIDDQGVEEFENANALDTSHLQLLDPSRDKNEDAQKKLADGEVSVSCMGAWPHAAWPHARRQ